MDLFKRTEQNITFRKTVDRDGWGSDPTPPEPIIKYSYKYGSAANSSTSPETHIPNVYSPDGVPGDYVSVTPTRINYRSTGHGLTRRTILVENLFSPTGALINSGWVILLPYVITGRYASYAQVRVVDPERDYYGDYKNIYPNVNTQLGAASFYIDFKSDEPINPIIEISVNDAIPSITELVLDYTTTSSSPNNPIFEVNQTNSFLTRDGRYSFKNEMNYIFNRVPVHVEGATYYQEPDPDRRLVEEIQTVIEPPVVPPVPDDTTVPAIVRYTQNIAGDETGVTDGSVIAFIKPKYKADIENFTINDILIINDVEFEIKKIDLRGVLPTDYSLRVEGVKK